jgi:hypothetical protein
VGVFTGTVPTYAAGDEVKASNMQTETSIETALTAAWTDWVPTLTNLTLGNGTQIAKYRQLGKTVDFIWQLTLGSTSAVGTTPSFTLPVAASTDYSTYPPWFGMLNDASSSVKPPAVLNLSSTTTVIIQYFSSLNTVANLSSTVPFTWTTSDVLSAQATYYTA